MPKDEDKKKVKVIHPSDIPEGLDKELFSMGDNDRYGWYAVDSPDAAKCKPSYRLSVSGDDAPTLSQAIDQTIVNLGSRISEAIALREKYIAALDEIRKEEK